MVSQDNQSTDGTEDQSAENILSLGILSGPLFTTMFYHQISGSLEVVGMGVKY